MEIVATSTIEEVSVFARGALVTRIVEVGPVDDGTIDVLVPDLTVAALPGSVRVRVEETSRRVVSVHTALEIPETRPKDAPNEARVIELHAEMQRLRASRELLVQRRDGFLGLRVSPEIISTPRRDVTPDVVGTRITEALRVVDLVGTITSDLDRRVAEITERLRVNERDIEAATLALQQSGASERDATRPTRACRVRLRGKGPVGALRITYAVEAAAWFPTHTIRFDGGGQTGEWTVEGLVVQATLEDWDGVKLSLSTADLGFDARLPELASLRLGRAQKKKARAYRALPGDLDRMFEAYDRAFAADQGEEEDDDDVIKTIARSESFDDAVTVSVGGSHAFGAASDELDEETTPAAMRLTPQDLESVVRMPQSFAAPAARAAMPTALLEGAMMKAATGFRSRRASQGAFERKKEPPPPPDSLPSIEPDDAWLDFDRLQIAGPHHARRGRLVLSRRESAGVGMAVARVSQSIAYDVLAKRGLFDHRYEALVSARVPSDGQLARVPIAKGVFSAKFVFRTVPSETQAVFREAVFKSPFPFPILGGPAQIFVEGNLVAQSELEATDRDGTVRVGTGVEERIKVARNVRATEETAGLLGGSLSVRHDVSIELSSSLGFDVEVHVIERVPITEDKAVEIEVLSSTPRAEPYDQASRGVPVKGGRQFIAPVAAGKKATCELSYDLKFSSKLEISGGNRRE